MSEQMRGSSGSAVKNAADKNTRNYTIMEKLLYKMDYIFITRWGQLYILFTSGLIYVAICGAVFMNVNQGSIDGEPIGGNFWEAVWESWTYMADAGTHWGVPQTLQARIIGFIITWGGIVFLAVIIGFVYDAIQEKMDALKKGKSSVIEEGHTIVLGWTCFTLAFILEICDANSSEGGGVIIVMSEYDKEDVEKEFYDSVKIKHLYGTKIIFRTGSALSKADLHKVSTHRARSILVLAPDAGDADKKDAVTLRTVLTLKGMNIQGYVVTELRDVDNERMVQLVGGDMLETVVSHDIIGRLLLLCARTPGLAPVYGEILGFSGDEFYMKEWPELVGCKFCEICTKMPDATPMGFKTPEEGDKTGLKFKIELIPDMNRRMQPGEELVVLAEDDDTYKPKHDCSYRLLIGEPPVFKDPPKLIEDILIVGWRRDIRDMLMLLDEMVMQGSKVHLLAMVPLEDRNDLLMESGFDTDQLNNFTLVHHEGNQVARTELENLPVEVYTSIIILADETLELNIMESDSQTLATLLLLRDIQRRREHLMPPLQVNAKKSGRFDQTFMKCPIICEILDSRTQKTIASSAYVAQTSEFIQSNQLISQALAMIAENRAVESILGEFLGSSGCELSLKDSTRYVAAGESTNFMVVVKRAQLFNEIVLGFQEGANCCMNPNEKLVNRVWDDVKFVCLCHSTMNHKRSISETGASSVKGGDDDDDDDDAAVDEADLAYSSKFSNMNEQLDTLDTSIKHMIVVSETFRVEQNRKEKIMNFIEVQKEKQAVLYI